MTPIAVLRTSHDRLSSLLTALSEDELRRPSYDDGWSIADVASHLGSGAEIFLVILRAGVAGESAPGMDVMKPIWDEWNALPPDEQASRSLRSNAELVEALEKQESTAPDAFQLDLWSGPTDLQKLASMRVSEHVVHSWDIAVALDPSADLLPDAVPLLLGMVSGLAGRAKPVEGVDPVVVQTDSDLVRVELSPVSITSVPRDDAGEPDVRLSDAAFVRLVYGRLDPEHTPAEATGDRLDDLRRAFPGF